ncbi:ParB-like protein [Chroococcidiopsis sp. TS-821]|uniref:ParB-like protein n=1 Tax=Chroococcidiopsis sp. TS-821 TaxID=1378066 RepID=UPI001AF0135E|nr:ParB-like protein [Chroococcidiopsis sp. TS-821]
MTQFNRVTFVVLILAYIFIAGFGFFNMATIPTYTSELPVGTLSEIEVSLLHPAQPALGYREVNYRVQQFKAMSSKELDTYLREHFLPVAIAPDGVPYVVDHHHRARAIQLTGLRETVYIKVLENCKDSTEAEFWQMMQENAWVYLYDKDGNPIEPDEIPANLALLQDDKYRSLAWAVLEAGGYQESNVPFQEFMWGNYFRQHISFEDTDEEFTKAVNEALILCRKPQASQLPGYIAGVGEGSASKAK